MSEDSKPKGNNRVNLTCPYSFLDAIDHHVKLRLDDGESKETANRAAVVLNWAMIGWRVEQSKMNKKEGEKTLNEQLKMMSRNILISSYLSEAIFSILRETADRDKIIKSETYFDSDFMEKLSDRVMGKLIAYFK